MFLPPKLLSYWKHAAVLVAIVIVAAGGYFIWSKYFKYDPVKVYQEAEAKYIAAMTADTYGGKTPQETLDMFVAALRAGDVELASKYFLLDENASREKWKSVLLVTQSTGRLENVANLAGNALPYTSDIIDDNDYRFASRNKSGNLNLYIDMRRNNYSGLWKIENIY